MTREELELELAEATVALQRLRILALRNSLTVTNREIFDTTAPLISFRALPDKVKNHVIRIRKERWNLQ